MGVDLSLKKLPQNRNLILEDFGANKIAIKAYTKYIFWAFQREKFKDPLTRE